MILGGFLSALFLFGLWFYVVYKSWQRIKINRAATLLYKALLLWPLILIDGVVRLLGFDSLFAIVGLFHFVPVLTLVYVLNVWSKRLQPKVALSKFRNIAVVSIAIASQIPLLMLELNHADWITTTPFAATNSYWQVYVSYIASSVGCIILATYFVDLSHTYHTYLPYQAVDIQRYYCRELTLSAAIAVVLFIAELLFVLGIAFGFFELSYWPVLLDFSVAGILLVLLYVSVGLDSISPCTIDYKQLNEASVKPSAKSDKVMLDAEKTMVAKKAYKIIGLTIVEFSDLCRVDPTELAIALKRSKIHNFRGLVFHYRMEYAKNVVMRSNASIATVAKRLGFHSEKFLSGPFLSYLEKRD